MTFALPDGFRFGVATQDLDAAVAGGFDSVQISVHGTAFDRYNSILDACHERGLEPVVGLDGEDRWLPLDAPQRYAGWVALVVDRLGSRVRSWVTTTGLFTAPGRPRSTGELVRGLDHRLTAHVLAYEAVKVRQPGAVSAFAVRSSSIYERGRLLTDVLVARGHGVARDDLRSWLPGRRAAFDARVMPWAGRRWRARSWAKATMPLEQALPRAVAAVYDSTHECTLDVVQLTYDAPSDRPSPAGLGLAGDLYADDGLDLWIADNTPRSREHLAEVVCMVTLGLPITGYWCSSPSSPLRATLDALRAGDTSSVLR